MPPSQHLASQPLSRAFWGRSQSAKASPSVMVHRSSPSVVRVEWRNGTTPFQKGQEIPNRCSIPFGPTTSRAGLLLPGTIRPRTSKVSRVWV